MQGLFQDQSGEAQEKMITSTQPNEKKEKPVQGVYTLEKYAMEFFRAPPKKSLSRSLSKQSLRRKDSNVPWGFTRVSLRQQSETCFIHNEYIINFPSAS